MASRARDPPDWRRLETHRLLRSGTLVQSQPGTFPPPFFFSSPGDLDDYLNQVAPVLGCRVSRADPSQGHSRYSRKGDRGPGYIARSVHERRAGREVPLKRPPLDRVKPRTRYYCGLSFLSSRPRDLFLEALLEGTSSSRDTKVTFSTPRSPLHYFSFTFNIVSYLATSFAGNAAPRRSLSVHDPSTPHRLDARRAQPALDSTAAEDGRLWQPFFAADEENC